MLVFKSMPVRIQPQITPKPSRLQTNIVHLNCTELIEWFGCLNSLLVIEFLLMKRSFRIRSHFCQYAFQFKVPTFERKSVEDIRIEFSTLMGTN